MKIVLNGNIYHLESGTGVKRSPMVEWPDNIRLDGQQQRKDRRWLSSWAIDNWSNGLLVERMNVDVATLSSRLWDVDNCDTRNLSIVRSPAFNTCTIVPSWNADLPLMYGTYGTDLYLCAGGERIAFKFSPPFSFGSYKCVASTSGVSSLSAVCAVGNRVLAVVGDKVFHTSALGAGATELMGSLGIVYNEIIDCGGTLHFLSYDGDKAHFLLGNLYSNTATINPVGTAPTTLGSYMASLETDGLSVYAQLPEGVYDFDDTPSLVVDTSRAKDLNCRQTMFQNELHFKNFKSLIKYDGTDVTPVGYDQLDGLPSDKWGEITAMCSSWKYTFAAVKGPSYSHILTNDGKAWQYYAKIPTGGLWVRDMFLSSSPDAIDRLWCIFGNYGYPGYFLNPMVNPLQAATYSFVPTGYFAPSVFDGGMAEEGGAFYDLNVNADVGGSNIITSFYGLNGASPISTLGVIATTVGQHIFGSPYGVEGYTIQPKFMLSGLTGTGPIFRKAILHYLKLPKSREEFEFTINLKDTADAEARPVGAVIGSLNSEREKKTLMPFWYGRIPTKAVRVLDIPSDENIEKDEIFAGEREGLVTLKVAEIL